MKKHILSFFLIMIPLLVFSQKAKKVMIIGIDGCRPDALEISNTPNIDQLISNGIFSPDALNDDITISGPGWSAILCGVWSAKHQVTDNSFSNSNYSEYPPFFKYIEDYDPTLNTVSICHWAPINDFIVQDYSDFKINAPSDAAVAEEADAYSKLEDIDVMFLHFDDVDHAGHSFGFSPQASEYITAIEVVDVHVGSVMESLQNRPTYDQEDWLILVTTDHGGKGTSHGGNSLEERNVFVIASGDEISTSVIEKDSTILPDAVINCLGDTTELAFDGIDDYVEVSPNPIFDFGSDQDFTVECRVRTSEAADVAIVGNKDWDSGAFRGFVFSFKYASGPEWKVNIGDGSNRIDINTGGEIADNEWHTLSASFDRDGFMKMYQDGMLLDSANISSIGDISTNAGLFFGGDINSNYNYSGSISEVRIWNTIIDKKNIEDWHCSSAASTHPNFDQLIGHWKMNEGIGNTQVVDYSDNGNNGIINGADWNVPDSIVIYDYSLTPRQTDIVPTALNHLCIPIDDSWDLDGETLTPICAATYTEGINLDPILNLYPNPATDIVHFQLGNMEIIDSMNLELYDASGAKVFAQLINPKDFYLDVSNFKSGTYLLTLKAENDIVINQKLIIASNH